MHFGPHLLLAALEGLVTSAVLALTALGLSLVFGVEVVTVLKDIWGLDSAEMMSVAQWAAGALVQAAMAESGG
ncbi:hypothetical protein EN792_056960 [Mesorhizobium sp. M00.F.Ca.ET.149.01.1.1]|nr:hypothetical protein EN792_056960 [Mesorhizobium sp. M00.F.Ca.ET.149.01.1.1]